MHQHAFPGTASILFLLRVLQSVTPTESNKTVAELVKTNHIYRGICKKIQDGVRKGVIQAWPISYACSTIFSFLTMVMNTFVCPNYVYYYGLHYRTIYHSSKLLPALATL